MASSLSTFHHLSSSFSPRTIDNAKLSSSLCPSPTTLSSNPNISLQFLNRKQPPFVSSTPRFLTVIAMAPPKPGGKAKKVVGLIKLALEAGKATPAPPVGPALGAKGVNIMAFCKDYNARTADKVGYVIPVEITVYDDRSFTFILKTPPASVLLLKAAGRSKKSFSSRPVTRSYAKAHNNLVSEPAVTGDEKTLTAKLEAFMEQMATRQQALEEQVAMLSLSVQKITKGDSEKNNEEQGSSGGKKRNSNSQHGGGMVPRCSKMEFPTYDGERHNYGLIKSKKRRQIWIENASESVVILEELRIDIEMQQPGNLGVAMNMARALEHKQKVSSKMLSQTNLNWSTSQNTDSNSIIPTTQNIAKGGGQTIEPTGNNGKIGVEKGAKDPKQEKVGKITIDQLRAIATEKLPDLNCTTIESAMRIIAGTAANMGIDIDPPVLEPKKKKLVL
ncbi:hypothetical protein GOBAR_AA25219 [Gossypium barbadense]|uniref:50S ribosomal protein L11, chloroplastic n=1 Tax=Gossypium barbadense TaxID=3634 RepID=A0A2P5WWJ4_GOSBA|nr:hypothetical protein GOBAR_AA25219 [Gossypium barbadense]